jgi:(2R)-ethylmalonyl-CoA mutase
MAERARRIESGEQVVVGVNSFTESEASPLDTPGNFLTVDAGVEQQLVDDVHAWRASRDSAAVAAALAEVRRAAEAGDNLMPPSIALAKAGGTTGEWASALRAVFGEYRGPTGVAAAVGRRTGELAEVADFVRSIPGGPPRFLVAKAGLDGHSNGAEQIAVAGRDAGMEVIYSGIRLTDEQIVASARDEDPDVIGLSILSGSHLSLVPVIIRDLRANGCDAPVIVGGIIPDADRAALSAAGVAAIYTPKDYALARIMREVAELAVAHRG